MNYDATIVTGHGRCGSSLVMQMLDAGGVPTTGKYPAFEDESFYGKKITDGKAWKCLDIMQPQLAPLRGDYRWIILSRNHAEQAKSQIKFAQYFGIPMNSNPKAIEKLTDSYAKDTPKIRAIAQQWGGPILYLDFEQILSEPLRVATAFSRFGFEKFDIDKAVAVVRKRGPECYKGLLEVELLEGRV